MNKDAACKASIAPATGIPVVPVRLSKEDCGDGREIVLRIDAKAELTLTGKTSIAMIWKVGWMRS
jgi:hypothetical protein